MAQEQTKVVVNWAHCPFCRTKNLYLQYKYGRLYKCVQCHKVITPGAYKNKFESLIAYSKYMQGLYREALREKQNV